ncbi:hypothetical protein AB0L70_00355 [Kribbella sp. NPDC051952]|uniref:hypothetical protein n=1 Tax=Kribbella sp. NPDC051952 TaxID=3154851 RepID=UPI003435FEA1
MAVRRRIVRWLLAVLGAVIILALVIYLISVGLDKADKLSSIISGVLAVAAVVVSLLWRRQPATPTPEPPKPPAAAPTGRMPYLEDVDQLAPPVLRDREDELAQLAAFCSDDNSSYWRWVADAWSGKTALLAWFVLHPPENADVISFFITTRFNPHGNRDAFIEAVSEQLDTLIGRRSSYDDRTPIRARHLQARLAEAAELSRQNGRHLVLVVDGLDEDRGVVIDSETYTVAALLPVEPVAGLKVIVAGRPHPPLPAELGANHPLRQNRNIHQLSASAHALANEATARVELRRLLADPLGRPVLGLLVAAGGGLSIADLAVLTRRPRHEVSQLVESSVGRTFISRPARWRHSTERYTFGLAHEELRRETLRSLDLSALTRYRESLTTWSAAVAADGWPSTTPEYLLRGYLGQLIENGHLDQAVDVATDGTRRERMFASTGGDHAARLEIAELTAALMAVATPDLGLLARLALHREYIDERNSRLPTDLPALWVKIGDDDRADALARGLSSERDRRGAVESMTDALIRTGDEQRLEQVVRTSADPNQVLRVLEAQWTVARRAGNPERVEALTAQMTELLPSATWRYDVLTAVQAVAQTDDAGAERVQGMLRDPLLRAFAGIGRIRAARHRPDQDLADRLADDVEQLANELPDRSRRDVLSELSIWAGGRWRDQAVAGPAWIDRESADSEQPTPPEPTEPGELIAFIMDRAASLSDDDSEQIDQLIDRAVPLLMQLDTSSSYWQSLGRVSHALATRGNFTRIWELAESGSARLGLARTDLAREVSLLAMRIADRGEFEVALGLLSRLDDAEVPPELLLDVVDSAVRHQQLTRARDLIDRLPEGEYRLEALTGLAEGKHRAGDDAEAQAIIDEWSRLADRVLADSGQLVRDERSLYRSIVRLAELCVEIGRTNQAAELANLVQRSAARSVDYPGGHGLRVLGYVLDRVGDAARADAIATALSRENQGELLDVFVPPDSVTGPAERVSELVAMAREAASDDAQQAGAVLAEAITTTDSIDADDSRVLAWERIVRAALAADLEDQVTGVLERIEAAVASLTDPVRNRALGVLVTGYRRLSRTAEAQTTFHRMTDGVDRDGVVSDWVTDVAAAGDTDAIEQLIGWLEGDRASDRAWGYAAAELAQAGDYRRADEFAGRVTEHRPRYAAVAVVEAAATAGDFEFAETVIARADSAEFPVELWCAMIRSADRAVSEGLIAGWLDRAEAAAATSAYSLFGDRAEALSKIAAVAEPVRARRLVARALVDGPWYVPLEPLARLDPGGFARLADEVIGLVGRRRASAGG